MEKAIQLAESAGSACAPNPRVGCVLVGHNGQEIGSGCTQHVGGPHAEIMALSDAASRGHSTIGATAYVTLEPGSHVGRTGPCCDALIAAGIAKVVASLEDPNPLVAGQGLARLQRAGIEIDVGLGAEASRELNPGFFSRMERQRPWVRMKIAASLDGTTALSNGASQWITSEAARTDGHAWRARACAVLTGIGTVLDDNPRLDARLPDVQRQPYVVVVDSRLETPQNAHLFIADRAVYIYAAVRNDAKQIALEERGATIVYLPGQTPETSQKVDLRAMLHDLAARQVNEVHMEAGGKLNGSFLREGLVDELLCYLAPKLLGPGQSLAALQPLTDLRDGIQLKFQSTTAIGGDLRILAKVYGAMT
jgi:diaminohydroxyphosphoribosylaminopyrimidine deaminase / 5-amino-6-(5-phosphoribosylamino)uracil reductase